MGPFALQAAMILANVAKVAESFEHVMHSGCIASARRLLAHLRQFLEVGKKAPVENKKVKISPHEAYLACLDIISYSAIHAAGLYRASRGYRSSTPAYEEIEKVEYGKVLRFIKRPGELPTLVIAHLGHHLMLKELSAMIMRTKLHDLLRSLVRCLFYLLCSYSHYPTAVEITAVAGTVMVRLTELLHCTGDETIGTLALCTFLQMCTQQSTRQALTAAHIDQYFEVRDSLHAAASYRDPVLQRFVAVTAALCRQHEWRAYDPLALPKALNGEGGDAVRQTVLVDLLRTLRGGVVQDEDLLERMSIADLAVLQTNEADALGMSQDALRNGAKTLVDFVVHPEEPNYFEKLPVHESAATCVILEGLAKHPATAAAAFSPGVINFMSRFIYLCKYLFLGKAMHNSQIMIVLNGVQASLVGIGRFAVACRDSVHHVDQLVQVLRKTEFVASALFFMKTLSVSHPKLNASTKELQQRVGCATLDFFNMYGEILLAMQGRSQVASMRDLYEPGRAVVDVSQATNTLTTASFLFPLFLFCFQTTLRSRSTISFSLPPFLPSFLSFFKMHPLSPLLHKQLLQRHLILV